MRLTRLRARGGHGNYLGIVASLLRNSRCSPHSFFLLDHVAVIHTLKHRDKDVAEFFWDRLKMTRCKIIAIFTFLTKARLLLSSLMNILNAIYIKDFAKDYFPFEFPGFGAQAHCFLRVRMHSSNILVLCAQLPNYHSTSVTNGLESIVDELVEALIKEGMLKIGESRWQFFNWRRGSEKWKRTRFAITRAQFLNRCRWFEYYPPGVGISKNGSLSLVTFNESESPSWSYGSRDYFEREYPADLFKINVNLESWITLRR